MVVADVIRPYSFGRGLGGGGTREAVQGYGVPTTKGIDGRATVSIFRQLTTNSLRATSRRDKQLYVLEVACSVLQGLH